MYSIDLQSTLDVLASQPLLLGAFLLAAGLVFMVLGIRVSRPLVSISFGVLGFVLCFRLPVAEEAKLGLAFMGAIGMGAASTFFIRGSLAILAGAWAAYAVMLVVGLLDLPHEAVLAIGAIAFGCAASLSLIMYQEVTAFVLSLEGSLLFIAGLVILMNQNQVFWTHIRDMLIKNPIFAPFALIAGAITGFYWQSAELRQRDAGTSA